MDNQLTREEGTLIAMATSGSFSHGRGTDKAAQIHHIRSGGSISVLNTMEVSNPKKCKRDSAIALDSDNDLSLFEAIKKSQSTIDVLDICTLKKLVLSFKCRFRKNIKACIKYQNQLEHFADSEVGLHDNLRKLKIFTEALELYPDLVNLNTIPSILNLLLLGFMMNPMPRIVTNPTNPGTWVRLSKSDFHKAKVKKKKMKVGGRRE
ncbi:hypothetical protein SLEP1_g16858 [Rubroshorea leprosula]|uniref:Beta-catenin-like protein 1 N-terminal domain-containing protein n=1 Tax=Rubroshorea leprosula TaxID=152421 RepID=A0AAV5J1I0_9ROSI|nr:hypothetical protein SLEP1_g16858 [Rubroshorea leprosula]